MRPVTRFYLTGGMGDAVQSLSAIQQYRSKYKEVEVYTQHKSIIKELVTGSSEWIKKHEEFKRTGFWINLCTTATYEFASDFKGFTTDEQADLFIRYSMRVTPALYQLARAQPYRDNEVAEWAIKKGLTRETLPCYMLGLDLVNYHCDKKAEHKDLRGVEYITVHNGHDPNFPVIGPNSMKQWHPQHWNEFVNVLRKKNRKIKVIQVGAKGCEEIDIVDINYVGRTSIQELLQVLSHSKLHIDGESGLVHAAAAMNQTSLVLYGPTKKEFFGHAGNIGLETKLPCKGCFWKKPDWMSNCVQGYKYNRCMNMHDPKAVASIVLNYLNRGKNGTHITTAATGTKKARRTKAKRDDMCKLKRRKHTG